VQVFHGVVHEGALLTTLLCSLQRYNGPTLSLFEMVKSACSPFCCVLHYLLFIKFIIIGFLLRLRDWTVAVAQYSKFAF
jgi:hypothetical protein